MCNGGRCDEGVFGSGNCTACGPGFWGPHCDQLCPGGSGAKACHGQGKCDSGPKGSGKCLQCDAAIWGPECSHACPQGVTKGGVCSGGVCDAGVSGKGTCTTCGRGYWGPECDLVCPGGSGDSACGERGICNDGPAGTGTCTECGPGYFGPHCDKHCPGGTGAKACKGSHGHCLDGPRGSGECLCNWAWRGTHDCSVPWGGIGVGAALFVAGCAIVAWAYRHFKRRTRALRTARTELKHVAGDLSKHQRLLSAKAEEVTVLQEAWRIDPAHLELNRFVAAGGEGRVYRGTWRRQFEVAVKMMLRDKDLPESWGFSNTEVKTMQRLRGSHLVHFCT